MDKTVSEIEDSGSGNSPERVPFWTVVVIYIFRLSVLGIALFILLDIDSVEDLIFNLFMFLVAFPFLRAHRVSTVNYHITTLAGVYDILFGMRRCRIKLPNRCYHLISRVAHRGIGRGAPL